VHDLADICGVAVQDDDVDSVGGLMAKHLGRVPIAGSVVEVQGLRLVAEAPSGRRNRIATVLISRVGPAMEAGHERDRGRERDSEPYPEHHAS
jgi:CBS domain containing-hemolysin-like protein